MPSSVPSGGCERVPQERGQVDRALDQFYQLALVLTLWITGLGLGMSFTPSQILRTLRRGGLLARAAVLDVVVVPLAIWGWCRGFSVPDRYATGLLLVGMASAGPLGIKAAQLARADLPYAIALVVVLGVANAVAIPVWVALLLPPGVQVPMGPVVRTLLLLVLAPLAVGMAIGARWPATAKRLAGWAPPLSTLGLVVVIALCWPALSASWSRPSQPGPAAVTAVLVALGWVGCWAGRPGRPGAHLAGDRGAGQWPGVGHRPGVVRLARCRQGGHRGLRALLHPPTGAGGHRRRPPR